MKELTRLPRPILGHRPEWIDLYQRAWAVFVPPAGWAAAHLVRALLITDSPAGEDEGLAPSGATQRQMDEWCARYAPPIPPPPDLASQVTALLFSQIIGVRLYADDASHGSLRHIVWHLTEPPPVGIHNLVWDDYTIHLLADQPQGGGLVVHVDSPVALLLEIVTPHTTFVELVAPGPRTLTLTVLDRTDVQANPFDQQ